ncbi:hypothetical protein [Flavobacterium capsici]|uniref:Uncharacterized protein n=1 Tax=Flavobacterium capsici TaxID=3075618 RepID=A0AA96F2X1_9FLAO|nr:MULTISPECIES: hypothetical protein [unclassified Flavobacterium]WNM18558.1 hypothetical protein RN608_11120 [Flavobacterium sp. PMR2A8]WNM22609.1 hypothetical protein RN605_04420 [Flavobacterium sp. PMTSA4]
MKKLAVVILVLGSVFCFAQTQVITKNLFIRVFDLNGHKINKGKISFVSDSIVQVIHEGEKIDIPVNTIGTIKTKRSAGHNALIGAAVAGGLFAIIGAVSAEPDASFLSYTPEQGAAAGLLLGIPAGSAVGLVTSAFKNSRTFIVNGDYQKWKEFEKAYNGTN